MQRKKRRLTRYGFERLLSGEWESLLGDRFRKNGPYVTAVGPGKKWFFTHGKAVSARNWIGIAKQLGLSF